MDLAVDWRAEQWGMQQYQVSFREKLREEPMTWYLIMCNRYLLSLFPAGPNITA